MIHTVFLNYDEDLKRFENIERLRFLLFVIEQMGVKTSDFEDFNDQLSIKQKNILRSILSTYNINVIENEQGSEIYLNKRLVAKWNNCIYKVIKNPDNKPNLILEVTLDFWTIFDTNRD